MPTLLHLLEGGLELDEQLGAVRRVLLGGHGVFDVGLLQALGRGEGSEKAEFKEEESKSKC